MRNIMMIFVIAIAATSATFGQTNKDEQAVRQVVNDLAAALRNNDAAALDRIYADDYSFVGDDGTTMTKAEPLVKMKGRWRLVAAHNTRLAEP